MGILYNQKQKELVKLVKSNYSLVEVKGGKILYNFRCHLNSVHYAIKNKHDRIAMVFYLVNNLEAILHFVNVNKKGELIDNTLGVWVEQYDVYLVEYIDKKDFLAIDNIFMRKREEIFKKLPWYIKITENYEI